MARMLGINHVALEVGDVDEAVDFYGRVFELELRGRVHGMAFLDMGDQFLALSQTDEPNAGRDAHVGVVVEDRAAVRRALADAGIELEHGRGLHFRDPWGNLIEVVQYSEIQFTKAPPVLSGMGLQPLGKSESAKQELRDKGLL